MSPDISRRNFVKDLGLVALAGTGLVGCVSNSVKPAPFRWGIPSNDAEIDCLVLGAGMSGITSARHIVDEGRRRGKDYNVVVLEGANRIGGRIETLNIKGNIYEMGAGYIHREKNTVPLWDEINKYNISVERIPKMDNGLIYHPKFGLKSITGAVLAWDVIKAAGIFNKVSSVRGEDMSAADFLERKEYKGLDYDFTRMILVGHMPAFLDELSMKGFRSDDIATQLKEKYEYRVSNGLLNLLERMSDGLDIRLNNKVKKIDRENFHGGVVVSLDDGRQYKAKSVVCTFSIGMLKDNYLDLNLPNLKRQALEDIDSGYHSKVIVKFNKRFWPKDASMIHIPGGRREGMTYFNHNYGLNETHPTLVGLLLGSDAKKMGLEDGETTLKNVCLDLDKIFPDFAPTIELVYRNPKSPHNGVHRKCWKKDEFARGGNSFLKFNPKSSIPIEQVREIFADARTTPGIFWGGEGTALSTQPASIHGAHESGIRVGKEVVEYLENGIILDPRTSSRSV